MKQKTDRHVIKIIVALLVWLLCIIGFCISGYVVNFMSEHLVYSSNREGVMKDYNERILDTYSIYALQDYQDNYNLETLNQTNFKFGILHTDDFESIDLNDLNQYEVTNFEKGINLTDANIYSCNLNEGTQIYSNLSLFRYSYISNEQNYDTGSYQIDGYYYKVSNHTFYYQANEMLFPGELIPVVISNGQEIGVSLLNDERDQWLNTDEEVELSELGIVLQLKDIKVIGNNTISENNALNVATDRNYYFEDRMLVIEDPVLYENDSYYVVSYVENPMNIEKNDLFVQAEQLVDWLFILKYVFPIIMGCLFILGCFCFLYVLGQAIKRCRQMWYGNVKLFWRTVLVLAGISFIEFILIVQLHYDIEVLLLFWLLEKVIVYPVIIAWVIQLSRIQKGSEHIMEDDFLHQVDVNHLYYDFKRIGDNLNTLRIEMEAAIAERMKSEHFKTELITNVSHDIKTPLTSIINYVDLLQKENIDNQTVKEYLEVLSRQSDRLKKLIDDLMQVSKAATGNLETNMETGEVNVALAQVVGEYEERLSSQDIRLHVTIPDEPVYIMTDSRHLQRIFDNLMINIDKYAQPMTRAYVSLEKNEKSAVITFRNTSKDKLNITSEELVERFVRGDESRSTEGHGLGLAIVQSLTDLMGGQFELHIDGDLFKVILKFPLIHEES